MKQYLLPKKIIQSQNVTKVEELFKPKGLFGFHNGFTEEWDLDTKLIGKGSSITIDFGEEMCGGIRILTGWIYQKSAKVRFRFGESLGEVNSELDEKGSCNDHGPRDVEMILSASADMIFGNTGFRYFRIDVLEDKYIYIRNIYCENNILHKKPIYLYKGKDQRIKDIFNTAKRTVDLCSSSGYIWDGIKRDRLVWVGDLAPEIMALSTMYGPIKEIERSLDVSKKMFPLPKFMNGIATYSMWWLIILSDYYFEFKKKDYAKKHLDYVVRLVNRLGELVDENGELDKNYRYLVDWPTTDTEDEEVGTRAIFVMAMNKTINLLNEFGLDIKAAKEIKRRVLLKPMNVVRMKQVAALKYFALGELKDEDYALLIKENAHGFSTFMSYYLLTAIASRDEKLAIKLMKEYYGALLDKGATTFWEDFDIDWVDGTGRIDEINNNLKDIHGDFGKYCYIGYRHSLCHGWSAGVIKFIKEHCK